MRWQSPYFDEGTWLRGNLHTHTVVSDGHYDLEQTAFFYGKNCTYKRNPRMNYRFLAITDHTTDAKRELFRRPETTEDGFILIEGREDSYSHHILGIGCPMTFQEDIVGKPKGTYTLEDNQRVIDKILEDGGIAVLAHPHWASQDYWTCDDARNLQGYTGIEIINGDVFSGPGNLATDVWDAALTAGKRVWAWETTISIPSAISITRGTWRSAVRKRRRACSKRCATAACTFPTAQALNRLSPTANGLSRRAIRIRCLRTWKRRSALSARAGRCGRCRRERTASPPIRRRGTNSISAWSFRSAGVWRRSASRSSGRIEKKEADLLQ